MNIATFGVTTHKLLYWLLLFRNFTNLLALPVGSTGYFQIFSSLTDSVSKLSHLLQLLMIQVNIKLAISHGVDYVKIIFNYQ